MGTMDTKTKKYYIHSAITIFFMFLGWFLPPMFGFPEAGMKALGIFAGMLWGWIFVEFGWPSLLGIIMLGMIGVITVPEALLLAFGTDMFLQLLFCMIFVVFIEVSGFATWFAKTMLKSKIIKGHPWRLITMYLLLTSVLFAVSNTFAATFLVYSFFKETAHQCGYKKEDLTVAYVLMGVVIMSTAAPQIMPFRTYPVLLQGILSGLGSTGVPYVPWMLCSLLATGYTILVYLFLGKFIFKIDVSKLAELPEDIQDSTSEKLTFEMKVALVLLGVFIATLTLSGILPNGSVKSFLNGFGLQGTAAIMVIFLLMYRKPDGSKLVTISTLASKGINWDCLFLLVSTLTLAAVFKLPEVGIVNALTTGLLPYVQDLSPAVFMAVCCIVFWAVTQVTHNLVIVLVLVGALSEVVLAAGANPWTFAFMFAMSCQFAFATPAACALGAIGYGDDWVGRKNAYKIGVIFSLFVIPFVLIFLPITTAIMGPWGA